MHGHLTQRVDSLEKTLMLGGIGNRTRRGHQRTGEPGGLLSMGLHRVGHDWSDLAAAAAAAAVINVTPEFHQEYWQHITLLHTNFYEMQGRESTTQTSVSLYDTHTKHYMMKLYRHWDYLGPLCVWNPCTLPAATEAGHLHVNLTLSS